MVLSVMFLNGRRLSCDKTRCVNWVRFVTMSSTSASVTSVYERSSFFNSPYLSGEVSSPGITRVVHNVLITSRA